MTRDDIYMLLPEHHLLSDQSLKETCADIWLEVLEGSKWQIRDSLRRCPIAVGAVSPDCPEENLSHTGLVARLCANVYDTMRDYFDKIGPCNRDYLLAGALIHDVGKFLEYDLQEDGTIALSDTARMFRHPCSGAYLAKNHRLPDEVVYIVLSHSYALSPEGRGAMNTPGSLIMKVLDDMVFNYARIFFPPQK